MKSLNRLILAGLLIFSVFITACAGDDPEPEPLNKYNNGILIANEGNFGEGNGSISYYSFDKDTVANKIFEAENNRPLGDVVQSVIRNDDKVIIAVNNSNKIEVVDGETFKSIATVDVKQPRYVVVYGGKAFVTSWANGGKVYVVNLDSYEIVDSITVGNAPEGLIVVNEKLYVANTGQGQEQTITIIKLSDYSIVKTLNIDAYSPCQLVKDVNGMIWVLASGQIEYDENWNVLGHLPAALVQIDPNADNLANHMYILIEEQEHPTKLGINKAGDKIYIGGGSARGLYAMSISATSAPTEPIIDQANYGFIIDKVNDVIFLLQAVYNANGKLIRYNADGEKLGEYTVGIFTTGGGKFFPDK